MAVTTQQIADLAGVSRGTVDRALHNRGRVSPEVADRIRRIAGELGYRPELLEGQQPIVRTQAKQALWLGAILQSTETPTMQIVLSGLRQAAAELRDLDVKLSIREIRGLDTKQVLKNTAELKREGIQGLALAPSSSLELRECINELHDENIPVITLNSDIPDSRRLCFVGMDNYRAGQTAAELVRQMLPAGGKILPILGHLNNTAHNNRLNGFRDTLLSQDVTLLPAQPCFDCDDYAHEITQQTLRSESDLSCIYVASHGQQGVCRAVEEEGKKGQIRVIAFDLNDINRRLLREGSLSFVLDQGAFEQGYQPPFLLYDYLTNEKDPARELLYTDIAIRTKYNMDSGSDETRPVKRTPAVSGKVS